MPNELRERHSQCLEWMCHPSPTSSPNGSDAKGEGEEDSDAKEEEPDNMDGVVAGLLRLASVTHVDGGLEASM